MDFKGRLTYSFPNFLNKSRIRKLRDKGNELLRQYSTEFLLKLYWYVFVLYLSHGKRI